MGLEGFGFGTKFITMIKTLSANTNAVVQTVYVFSKKFALEPAVHCSATFCAVKCQFYSSKINWDKTLLIALNNATKHFILPAILPLNQITAFTYSYLKLAETNIQAETKTKFYFFWSSFAPTT